MSILLGLVGVVAVLLAFVELLARRQDTRLFYVVGSVGWLLCQVAIGLLLSGK